MSMYWLVLDQIDENDEDNPGPKKVIPTEERMRLINDGKWRKKDLNRIVMNFLVTEGYAATAEKFQEESGAEPAIGFASMRDRRGVTKLVASGNIDVAIEKFKQLYPEIWEGNHELAFHLLQQRFIELTRSGTDDEALLFSQEEFAQFVIKNPKFLEEMERTLSLLVLDDASSSRPTELLDRKRWKKIAGEVNAAILRSQNQEQYSQIEVTLKELSRMQKDMDAKFVYPHITDFSTAKFEYPAPDASGPY